MLVNKFFSGSCEEVIYEPTVEQSDCLDWLSASVD